MKINKLENRITFFIITLGIFLLNFKNLSLLSLIFGLSLALFIILLFDKIKIYKYKLTKILLLFISFAFMIFYLNKTSYFISDNILREYSTISISFTLLSSIFVLGNKGYHTIIKVILLASYFLIFFLGLGIILNISYVDLSNLNTNILKTNHLMYESLYYTFLLVFTYFLIYPISNTTFKSRDLIVSGIYQIIIFLLVNSILGTILVSLFEYPYITIYKKVNLIGFIERIEIIFSMNYLFCFYFLLLLSFYQIKNILERKIKKDKKLTLILIFLTLLIFLISTIF